MLIREIEFKLIVCSVRGGGRHGEKVIARFLLAEQERDGAVRRSQCQAVAVAARLVTFDGRNAHICRIFSLNGELIR